ncbi:DNA mismatch repair protein [Halorubrum ezzemoulense]|uniref:DNA mismatch repair protein n=1 Tax=Halorubrum ezzemoulense TaxID=337243 RepID=A0ABT4YXQ7_HALEZ|nr:DNA mismatch repair protein [Halorubrum ezzemoulense]MDB2245288.1 DNA mismatch repair protein [Halorubrum ezzemoulense]MDB2250174.1 DNA mismatch repair protein [Halorubrum ezzemoulense]MDB2279334.1 DNA mismatch repair protein [Halorubrum ezzemoulense]MDB2285408.1 DNA mismatch repair protein [Halorubrum ezzemoulense]MDB2287244.1 DNA mismatch repair protein [Halorubrum ezzemoulense]
MRLQDYWGIGPKTRERLAEALGTERAVEAIESADVRALVDAGLHRGRATRILRRANGEAGMDVLATGDARSVYDDLLGLAADAALTAHAADRIRVLTPLLDRDAVEARLDRVVAARDAWTDLDEADREAVADAFDAYDEAAGSDLAAVETAVTLREAGLTAGPFADIGALDGDRLRDAADALADVRGSIDPAGGLDGDDIEIAAGADAELDRLREQLSAARDLADSAFDVLESVRDGSLRDFEALEAATIDHVASETGVEPATVRAASPDEALDAADFVSGTLRDLVVELEAAVEEREAAVAADIRERLGDESAGRDDATAGGSDGADDGGDTAVARAASAVSDAAFLLSLGRFAAENGHVRPTLVDDGIAVRGARNPFLGGDVQPVSYGVGSHSLADASGVASADAPPTGDRVSVLTGANSGGKTTLLETLCAVALLASMGLPVPADAAEVGTFDRIVFHRRHASFNAGVLESTLKSVVPPLVADGRTLMLVDEFEAITEPGRAADLLNGLVTLTVDRGALGVYVTHLAEDLSPLPEAARIDGIFAEGLTNDLELRVDYQPRFETVGKSTPEFIVSRLVANAGDRGVRAGFEHLAGAVGEEAVQRTLSDAEWAANDD